MPKYLFMFSVGPVQEFIEASRRSRDLHWSSQFIQKMARSAAAALKDAVPGTQFVAPPIDDKFNADGSLVNEKALDDVPTSDRVLAIVQENKDLDAANEAAKAGAYAAWDAAIAEVEPQTAQIGRNDTAWTEQKVEQRVEFFSAWVPLQDDESDFKERREQVECLLNAREEFCDFDAAPGNLRNPKSSLDGRRESVLGDATVTQLNYRQTKRIKKGEQLDLPGLVKRLAPDQHFPPGSRIAVDPFIRGVYTDGGPHTRQREKVDEIKQRLNDLETAGRTGFFTTTSPRDRRDQDRYGDFPYDGHQLFADRLDSLKGDYPSYAEDLKDLKEIVAGAKISPYPYLAVIACDGDGMGSRIKSAPNAAANSKISTQMQTFAASVNGIVETAANGSAIFAGGDDVLAFVPLDRTLECVEALQQSFRTNVDGCTLSIGVAIVHMLTPMAGEMIAHALEAEGDAKSGRWEFNEAELGQLGTNALAEAKKQRGNAVAFHLYKRSGAPIKVRMAWPDAAHGHQYNVKTSPVTRMKGWAHLLREDLIPDRLAYELRTLARHYGNAGQTGPQEDWVTANLLHGEVKRLLGKKQKGDHDRLTKNVRDMILDRIPVPPADANDSVKQAFAKQAWLSLDQMAEEIIVARALLPAYLDSGGPVNFPEAQEGGAQ